MFGIYFIQEKSIRVFQNIVQAVLQKLWAFPLKNFLPPQFSLSLKTAGFGKSKCVKKKNHLGGPFTS